MIYLPWYIKYPFSYHESNCHQEIRCRNIWNNEQKGGQNLRTVFLHLKIGIVYYYTFYKHNHKIYDEIVFSNNAKAGGNIIIRIYSDKNNVSWKKKAVERNNKSQNVMQAYRKERGGGGLNVFLHNEFALKFVIGWHFLNFRIYIF